MKAIVYVDALNLYYRALRRNPPLKWLNPLDLCRLVLPNNYLIKGLNYYTARVSGKFDKGAPQRQGVYLKALETVPEIEIFRGRMYVRSIWARLAHKPGKPYLGPRKPWLPIFPRPENARVIRNEEKGSDVNLGCHLVRDAFQGKFDVGVIVTNDTDLVEPIKIVVNEVKLPVCLICPTPRPAGSLASAATYVRHIDKHRLKSAQFPNPLIHPDGTELRRPQEWV